MKACLCRRLYLISALFFGLLVLSALLRLPPFGGYRGPYGDMVMSLTEPLRHTGQGVAAVTFDFRGFDTLGEEFILYAAVAGALLLLRPQEKERSRKPVDSAGDRKVPAVSPVVHAAGILMFPCTFLLGIAIIVHGHLTPGGGFQGGVILASAFYFIYLSGEYHDLATFLPDHLPPLLESAGAGGFALLAAIPLLLHKPFMENILPMGSTGDLLSAGCIPVYNCAVGLETGAAFVLLIMGFIHQILIIREKKR